MNGGDTTSSRPDELTCALRIMIFNILRIVAVAVFQQALIRFAHDW